MLQWNFIGYNVVLMLHLITFLNKKNIFDSIIWWKNSYFKLKYSLRVNYELFSDSLKYFWPFFIKKNKLKGIFLKELS